MLSDMLTAWSDTAFMLVAMSTGMFSADLAIPIISTVHSIHFTYRSYHMNNNLQPYDS